MKVSARSEPLPSLAQIFGLTTQQLKTTNMTNMCWHEKKQTYLRSFFLVRLVVDSS